MSDNKQLKDVGLKITTPRVKVLEMLEQSREHHLSAENIYKALVEMGDDVALATVYRVLAQFEAAGLVTRHNFEGGCSVFELSDSQHHDHLVCLKCSRVQEFFDEIIEQRQINIAMAANFQMMDHDLTIYGFCADCQG